MSYNINNIDTLESTLTMTAASVRELLDSDELPENCFLYDLDLDNCEDDDEIEVDSILWADTGSGRSFDLLKAILLEYCEGNGKFVVIWEDGATSGLKVEGEGTTRVVTEPVVKMEL